MLNPFILFQIYAIIILYKGTSKNRFEKGKWVEGLKKQSVCYTHFHSNEVFRGDHNIFKLSFMDETRAARRVDYGFLRFKAGQSV